MGYPTDIAFSIDSARITVGLDELDAATGAVIAVQPAPGHLWSVVPGPSAHEWLTAGTTGVGVVTAALR